MSPPLSSSSTDSVMCKEHLTVLCIFYVSTVANYICYVHIPEIDACKLLCNTWVSSPCQYPCSIDMFSVYWNYILVLKYQFDRVSWNLYPYFAYSNKLNKNHYIIYKKSFNSHQIYVKEFLFFVCVRSEKCNSICCCWITHINVAIVKFWRDLIYTS